MTHRVPDRPITIEDIMGGRLDGYYRWSRSGNGKCFKCPIWTADWRDLFKGTRIEVTSPSRSAILSTGHLCDQHAIQLEMAKRRKLTDTK